MILGKSPLSPESQLIIRAVQNGATTLAESFLFMVAAGLVIGETWRSNRKEGKRRDDVRDRLEGLEENMQSIKDLLERGGSWKESIDEVKERYVMQWVNLIVRNEDFERILSTVVNNGLRAGWLSLGHGDGLGEMLPMLDPSKRPITKTIDAAPVTDNTVDSPLMPDPEPALQKTSDTAVHDEV